MTLARPLRVQLRALLSMGARRGVGGGKEAFPRRSCGAPQGRSRIGVCSSLGQTPARPWADWSGFGQPLDNPWAIPLDNPRGNPQATPRADLGQAMGGVAQATGGASARRCCLRTASAGGRDRRRLARPDVLASPVGMLQMKPYQQPTSMSSDGRSCRRAFALNNRDFVRNSRAYDGSSVCSATVAGRSQDGYCSPAHPERGRVFPGGSHSGKPHRKEG